MARIGFPFLFFALLSLLGFAQSGIITTYAGPGMLVNGSLATTQAIYGPSSVTSDGASGFYVALSGQNQVYRVTADGRINLIAGNGTAGFSGDGGPATSAQLNNPMGVALDSAGNLFIADFSNQVIREVTPGGVISTVAGDGTQGYSGDGGPATLAELNCPTGVALDSADHLFIADSFNSRIRKVTNGLIATVAGNGAAGYNGDYETNSSLFATTAQLNYPTSVVIDATGNLFIADTFNQRIRKVTTDGYIHTAAGIGTQGFSGDGGQATSAELNFPLSVVVDSAGNLFVADAYNFRIRKVASGGVISTVAGNGAPGFGGDGGQATSAQLSWPSGLMEDTAGNLFIADYFNGRVREVTSGGTINTVAGIGTQQGFSGDGGQATSAKFHLPAGVALDSAGNLFIADSSNARVRKVTPGGVITTAAGNGTQGSGGDGGQATSAQLSSPVGVAVDTGGNLFIADYVNQRVRKVTPAGVISTIAGNGTAGFSGDGGPASSAQLNGPWGVAVDSAGNLFIADLVNHCIRKVTAGGVISTVAGTGKMGFSGDGALATSAQLNYPAGVAVDASGNLFIADSGNNRVRKVTPGGVISTVAGNGLAGFSGDGRQATSAQIYSPTNLAFDAAGNLLISDHNNNRIRMVTPAGVISTIAGNGIPGFSGDGSPATSAQLNFPMGLAVDATGDVLLADYDNNRIRKVAPQYPGAYYFPQIAAGSGFTTILTITNTGSTTASGTLILTDPQGNPLSVKGTLTDATGITHSASSGSAFPLTVPAGKTISLSVSGWSTGGPVQVGWGQLNSTSGSLTGVATYEYLVGSTLQKTAGALQSPLLQYATIAVDNDSSQGKQTAYVIANPSDEAISVQLAFVEQNGALSNATTLTLGPKQQIAEYVSRDLAPTNFKGTLVIQGQAGESFVAVAVLDTQGLLTAIPVISGKAPGVTN
jgi:sugar lactone lactonase YvrE